jgi:hypothetical protein
MITASAPVTVARHDALAARGLHGWPDGIMGYRWPPAVRDNPVFHASSGGVMATVDITAKASHKCPPARGLPPEFSYAAGGRILTNPCDGSWLLVAHCERKPTKPPRPGLGVGFWSCLAWLRSTDGGANWSYLGTFIEPCARYADPLPRTCEIAGGAVAFAGPYLYCYFRESDADYHGRAGMAYSLADEVFALAAHGAVAPWSKWAGSPLPSGDDPPAVGGGLAEQLPGLPEEADWCDVAYLADRRLFLMAYCPWADKKLHLATSADGLTWKESGPPLADPGVYHYYPTLVGTNADERFVTGPPWLYYVVTPADPFRWEGSEVRRRRLAVG